MRWRRLLSTPVPLLVLLIAACSITAVPEPSTSFAEPPTLVAAIDLLEILVVVPEHRGGYDRDLFVHWADSDGDGCDTRREVLLRDARSEQEMDPYRECWIVSGLWYSVYDDVWIEGVPSGLHVDHLVPLAEAWDSGAFAWSPDRREAFANDEAALLAVTALSNKDKGAADPAEWMPANLDYTCWYVAGWIAVKAKWELTVDPREADFLHGLLDGECSGWTLDLDSPALATPTLRMPGDSR